MTNNVYLGHFTQSSFTQSSFDPTIVGMELEGTDLLRAGFIEAYEVDVVLAERILPGLVIDLFSAGPTEEQLRSATERYSDENVARMGQAIAERWGVPETVSVDGIGEMPTIDAVKSNDLLASLRTAYAGDADALRGIDAMRFVVELQARATELLLEHQQATTIEAQREEFQQTGYAYDLLPSAVEPGMPRQVEMLVEAKAQLVGAQAMVAEYTQVEGQPFDCQKAAMLQNANRHLFNAQTEFMRLADLFANNPEHLSIVMDYLTERAAAAGGPAPEIIPTLTPQAAVAAP